MQHVYRDLVSHPTAQPESSEGVVEASAGLDLFSFRRIFFGTPDSYENNKSNGIGDVPVMFMPYDLAGVHVEISIIPISYDAASSQNMV